MVINVWNIGNKKTKVDLICIASLEAMRECYRHYVPEDQIWKQKICFLANKS